ncbi:MAG TPA: ATP-binding protein [Nitrososphaeraceae archaeon]|nr:ATP-binding protein [Nitrososphaeraceae archaeon]
MESVSTFLKNERNLHLFKYVIIPSVYLLFIVAISLNPYLWITSSIHHFYIELFGTLLAGILAFYYLLRAHSFNDKFSLFIGIGFLVNALIDLLHVVISLINMDDPMFLKYFIPQTWFAGRLFLSAMLLIAIIKYNNFLSNSLNIQENGQLLSDKKNTNKLSKILIIYLVATITFASIIAISSIFIVFPFSVVDHFPLHRPYELFPLSLFIFSIYYFYRNRIYENKDVLYVSIVLSIMFDIFGQIIMSSSKYHFDTAHNVAHLLKDISYFINIIGLALSSIHYNIKLKESNELLNLQYKKVKESEKMKEEFINIAAHELRTPIQPILGLTDIIYSKIQDKEQHELLEIILRNANRLKRLTDNVLDVPKIESQSLILKKEKLNLDSLISEVLKEYVNKDSKQQQAKIVYDFRPKDDIIIIRADKDRLTQVIRNLMDNALKFTTYNQTISVTVELEIGKKDKVVVSVKDTGEGISKDVFPNLFSKFTTSDSSIGTGLGLYICKNIVEAHGGKIWAENNENGIGAIFKFTLPLID